MRDCSALVSSSQQCLAPQDPGDNKRFGEPVVGPLKAPTLGKQQLRPWEAELGQRAGALSPGVEVGKGGHSHTWWGNPGVGPQGFLQGDVGDLTGVSGSRRARLHRQGGGDAVGASWAAPEVGEGGARDRGWGATLLLPGPGHRHIQGVVASNIADESGLRGCVQQAQSYFGGSWKKGGAIKSHRDHRDSRGAWSLLLLLSMTAGCGGGRFLLSEVRGASWRQDITGHDSHTSLKNNSKTS